MSLKGLPWFKLPWTPGLGFAGIGVNTSRNDLSGTLSSRRSLVAYVYSAAPYVLSARKMLLRTFAKKNEICARFRTPIDCARRRRWRWARMHLERNCESWRWLDVYPHFPLLRSGLTYTWRCKARFHIQFQHAFSTAMRWITDGLALFVVSKVSSLATQSNAVKAWENGMWQLSFKPFH